jgi:hypothetical protein
MHGDNIIRLPVATLLTAGYAVVTFSPGQVVPDDPLLASAAIERLPPSVTGGPRVGAIGAWSWSISCVTDAILTDPRLDPNRLALFGHSRFGKAALLTAALDTRIQVVIANQSGDSAPRRHRTVSASRSPACSAGFPIGLLRKQGKWTSSIKVWISNFSLR